MEKNGLGLKKMIVMLGIALLPMHSNAGLNEFISNALMQIKTKYAKWQMERRPLQEDVKVLNELLENYKTEVKNFQNNINRSIQPYQAVASQIKILVLMMQNKITRFNVQDRFVQDLNKELLDLKEGGGIFDTFATWLGTEKEKVESMLQALSNQLLREADRLKTSKLTVDKSNAHIVSNHIRDLIDTNQALFESLLGISTVIERKMQLNKQMQQYKSELETKAQGQAAAAGQVMRYYPSGIRSATTKE